MYVCAVEIRAERHDYHVILKIPSRVIVVLSQLLIQSYFGFSCKHETGNRITMIEDIQENLLWNVKYRVFSGKFHALNNHNFIMQGECGMRGGDSFNKCDSTLS